MNSLNLTKKKIFFFKVKDSLKTAYTLTCINSFTPSVIILKRYFQKKNHTWPISSKA